MGDMPEPSSTILIVLAPVTEADHGMGAGVDGVLHHLLTTDAGHDLARSNLVSDDFG